MFHQNLFKNLLIKIFKIIYNDCRGELKNDKNKSLKDLKTLFDFR